MAKRASDGRRFGPSHTLLCLACGAVMGLGALAPGWTHAGTVQVAVTGVSDPRGHVRVQLCTKATFLTSACPYRGAAPAIVGATLVTIDQVPPGRYAVQAFDDPTDEGEVHQNLLGIPRERIGFSNDAPVGFNGPRFRDAAFSVDSQAKRITLKLRAFFRRGD